MAHLCVESNREHSNSDWEEMDTTLNVHSMTPLSCNHSRERDFI